MTLNLSNVKILDSVQYHFDCEWHIRQESNFRGKWFSQIFLTEILRELIFANLASPMISLKLIFANGDQRLP